MRGSVIIPANDHPNRGLCTGTHRKQTPIRTIVSGHRMRFALTSLLKRTKRNPAKASPKPKSRYGGKSSPLVGGMKADA